jgi:hypothetical protein
MNRVRKLTLAGSAAPDLRSVKKLYIELMQLQEFVRLNGTGFRKIVKKFDKTVHRDFLPKFMENLKNRQFMRSSAVIKLVEKTTSLVSRDKLMDFKTDAQAIIVNPGRSQNIIGEQGKFREALDTFFGSDKSTRPWAVALTAILTAVAFNATPFEHDDIANRALAFLTLVVSLWITKAIPFHATSMLIPPLAVLFRVLRGEGGDIPLEPKEVRRRDEKCWLDWSSTRITPNHLPPRAGVQHCFAQLLQPQYLSHPGWLHGFCLFQ